MGTDHVCRFWPNPAPFEAIRSLCSWILEELDTLNWCSDFLMESLRDLELNGDCICSCWHNFDGKPGLTHGFISLACPCLVVP